MTNSISSAINQIAHQEKLFITIYMEMKYDDFEDI